MLLVDSINEPRHEISNNAVYVTSKASDQPAHMPSLTRAFASRLNILFYRVSKLKRGLHIHVKMPHCWKSHVTAQILMIYILISVSAIISCPDSSTGTDS